MREFRPGDMVRLTDQGRMIRRDEMAKVKGVVISKKGESVTVQWQGMKEPWTEKELFLFLIESSPIYTSERETVSD